MPNGLSLYLDNETREEFKQITDKLKKSRSQVFRDMVKYFYEHKENLSSGLRIEKGSE